MSKKALITVGVLIGSTVGGYVPSLFGADLLSAWEIFGSLIGGILGIYLGLRFGDD